jgi:peptidoglycan/LPS O-acetylase OafA/YrhL
VFPLYGLGWSLNYEMFFYAIFALFLFAPRARAVGGVVLVLAGLVVAGLVFAPKLPALEVWTSGILLEFGFGLCIGLVWLGRARLPSWICLVLALLAVGLLLADPAHLMVKNATGTTPNDLIRVAGWGIPAACLLLAAVFLEKGRNVQVWGVASLRRVGDASYALYLVHPMVLIFLLKILSIPRLANMVARTAGPVAWPVLGAFCVCCAICAGFVTHHWIEKPMTRWLNVRISKRR